MTLPSFNLAGKVALVTGCNTGLGQAMAIALAEAGADVVQIYTGLIYQGPQLVRDAALKIKNTFQPS